MNISRELNEMRRTVAAPLNPILSTEKKTFSSIEFTERQIILTCVSYLFN